MIKNCILLTLLFSCIMLSGCNNVQKTEKIEKKETVNMSIPKADTTTETATLVFEKNTNEYPKYTEWTDENGVIHREIYTNDASNFEITIPDDIIVYSYISVKNVISEDGKHGGATIPYVTLYTETGTFDFVYGSTPDFYEKGFYVIDDKTLILNSDNQKTYIFNFLENGMIEYDASVSSEIPLENEKSYIIEDKSTFYSSNLLKN